MQRSGGVSVFGEINVVSRRPLILIVRPHHTFMTKRTLGALFCCLAVVLYLSRYVFALWYGGGGRSTWSSQLFASDLECVGIAPWGFAAAFLVAGIFYLVRAEKEK